MPAAVVLDGTPLCLVAVEEVARRRRCVEIGRDAYQRMDGSRAAVERAIPDGRAHYGINTGFGSLSRTRIAGDDLRNLQHNLIRSHAAGIGSPLPEATVRAMMIVLAASLCRGVSGVRPLVVEQIVRLLNEGITPVVPSLGSVGASGDLAPLAHVALVLTGEGCARFRGVEVEAAGAFDSLGMAPLALEAKEGLALINGTHLMAAEGALLCADVDRLMHAAVAACAMSIDACKATDTFLDPRVYDVRNHRGAAHIANLLREQLANSEIIPSHRHDDTRVQDPYSFRCAAYILGAAYEAIQFTRRAIEAELGAVTDNPLVFPDNDVVSAGNFHGMPVALPLDVLAIALSHVAGVSQQRTFFMLAARDPETGLVPYLSPQPGLCSGLMVAQYTAAACCNELVGLAAPASVANIQTSAGMEDYNSFGPRAAAKARRAVELGTNVIAIELLCAAQGLEYHRPLRSGEFVEETHARIRGRVPALTADRPPSPDIAIISSMIDAGVFSQTVALPSS